MLKYEGNNLLTVIRSRSIATVLLSFAETVIFFDIERTTPCEIILCLFLLLVGYTSVRQKRQY